MVTPEDNILSSDASSHGYDVTELIKNAMYDIDDIRIINLNVKERK